MPDTDLETAPVEEIETNKVSISTETSSETTYEEPNAAANSAAVASSAPIFVSPPSINDEEAFPALGSASSVGSPSISWGPSMSTASSSRSNSPAHRISKSHVHSSTVQEAFHISNAVALNISKVEFAKIVNELKKAHNVSIESTLSSITKNRSFIVTGKINDVARVRKELVRRLTKPVKITFKVPTKTRLVIIGAGGRNLKPIVEATQTKINIEKPDIPPSDGIEDDDKTIQITIEGDIDGVEEAKKKIMSIVDEETKNLTTKIAVPEKLIPFVQEFDSEEEGLTVTGPTKNNIIIISGLRDSVVLKKAEISKALESLSIKIKSEQKVIPQKVHQFIDTKELLEKFQVVVSFSDNENDEIVTFTGLPAKITQAIQYARNSTAQFAIDLLDISKAHGGNITHAKSLAAYFQHSGIFHKIGEDNNAKVSAPAYSKLASEDLESVAIEITAPIANTQSIKASRKQIVDKVNSLGPSRIKYISDINSLFTKRVIAVTESSAKQNNVYVVPLANKIILVALDADDEEFAPSQEEIDARLNRVDESLNEIRQLQANLRVSVLIVPEEKQQFIEGPNGTTLRAILSSFESSILTIKLHSDGKSTVSNKVFIQGLKSDVAKAEKEIESLLKDAEDIHDIYSFQVETKVPTTIISRLIGKNGANLNSLREQFNVEIDVGKNPTGEKTLLSITGYKFNVKEAEQYITQTSKKWADEITKTLTVPKKYRSSLIGANGQYVKKLQNKYNVRITFSQSSDDVVIKGPSRGVTKAEVELKDLLDYEIENGYTKKITIPQSAVSRVIGRQGDNINRIVATAGVDINLQSDDKDADTCTITLTGSRKGLTEAEKAINAIVKEVQDSVTIEIEVNPKYFRYILGPRGSMKQQIIETAGGAERKEYRRLLQLPEQGSDLNKIVSSGPKDIVESIISQIKKIVQDKEKSITEKVEVPKERHVLLIGPAGSVRRSIEEEFNVNLNIPKFELQSDEISISGLPENVEKAKAKVAELTADNWKVEIEVPSYLHFAISERGAFTRRIRLDYNVEVEHGDASKKAFKLSNSLPIPPASALGSDEETIKFTTIADESIKDEFVIPWRLKGGEEEVAQVEKIIKESLIKYAKNDINGYLWVKDPSVFGKVVGLQGSRLRNIRKESDAEIYIPRDTDNFKNVIILKGNEESLRKAYELLRVNIEKS